MTHSIVRKAKALAYRFLSPGILRRLQVSSDWIHTRIWNSSKIAVTPLGFKLAAGSYSANRQMQSGDYERDETELVKRFLETADLFVDVGANIGFYSCLAKQLKKKCVAVEPQPSNVRYLLQNFLLNGWPDSEVFPVGLSDRAGLSLLYGASGPSASLLEGWGGYSSRFHQIIPVNTLDAILGERFEKERMLIKIDVEGAEFRVLLGATRTLTRIPSPVWHIEICLDQYHPEAGNPNFLKTFELFWRFGYQAFVANREMRRITRRDIEGWLHQGRSEPGVLNFLFVKEGISF